MPSKEERIDFLEEVVLRQNEMIVLLLNFLEKKKLLEKREFNFLIGQGPYVVYEEDGGKTLTCPGGEWEHIDEYDERLTVELARRAMNEPGEAGK